ncbi:CGA synthase-related protein [Streptomyces sp. NPDC053048]|uniref:CGA synthase-related protein n=1 Tax=Streptomyces sp. NPDC053048 TaxID=3365694 RepID=UPI0037D82C65
MPRPVPADPARPGTAPPGRRVLLVDRPGRLDSLTARRRIAAHLTELALVREARETREAGDEAPPADAALVCDDPVAAGELSGAGVPVVYVHSGHTTGALPVTAAASRHAHVPGWLPGPAPGRADSVRAAGVLAPARLSRDRARSGCLLLLSAWEAAEPELGAYAEEVVRPLVLRAVDRSGGCTVVYDAGHDRLHAALAPLPGVTLLRAADADADALHASARVFLASPTLTAVSLAQARRAPLAFLPPLGPVQDDLARRVRQVVPVPVAGEEGHDRHDADAGGYGGDGDGDDLWAGVDPATDDLRGAQRVARAVRQLVLAPTGP